jgi:hypothetical protein
MEPWPVGPQPIHIGLRMLNERRCQTTSYNLTTYALMAKPRIADENTSIFATIIIFNLRDSITEFFIHLHLVPLINTVSQEASRSNFSWSYACCTSDLIQDSAKGGDCFVKILANSIVFGICLRKPLLTGDQCSFNIGVEFFAGHFASLRALKETATTGPVIARFDLEYRSAARPLAT